MKLRKKILNTLIIFSTSVVLCVIVFEATYRFQIFDFYKAELKGLNSTDELKSSKSKILICGDSFSASLESYVKTVRDSLHDYSVINSAVPGTGILQHVLYMPKRIKKIKPKIFIYQYYVGNDLFDIRHPVSSKKISLFRKAYWSISDRLLSISFLNFRFAGIKYNLYDDAGGNYRPKDYELFSVNHYSKREKLNYLAEPGLVYNTLFLHNGRDLDWLIFEKKFKSLVSHLDGQAKKYFVIIPHEAQMSPQLLEKHHMIGAHLDSTVCHNQSNAYPLYNKIMILCHELGFEVIDPLNLFRSNVNSSQLYYSNDPHLNSTGQKLLGNYILSIINDKQK